MRMRIRWGGLRWGKGRGALRLHCAHVRKYRDGSDGHTQRPCLGGGAGARLGLTLEDAAGLRLWLQCGLGRGSGGRRGPGGCVHMAGGAGGVAGSGGGGSCTVDCRPARQRSVAPMSTLLVRIAHVISDAAPVACSGSFEPTTTGHPALLWPHFREGQMTSIHKIEPHGWH